VIPEGTDGFIGSGSFSGSRQQHDPQSSGQFSQGEHSQFGQQSQGQFNHADGQGFSGRSGLTGTIETIEDNVLTLNTPQGPLEATVGESTTVRRFTEAVLPDLSVGMRVTVTGQRGEDGVVQARSILVIPEAVEGELGGDFFSRDHQQPDQQ